jgi:hypothetical protein
MDGRYGQTVTVTVTRLLSRARKPTGRSGIREGVGPRGRPAAVHLAHRARRRPFCVLQPEECLWPSPARMRDRPVIRGRWAAVAVLPGAHRVAHAWGCPPGCDRAGMAARRGTTPARCPCGSFSDAALPNPLCGIPRNGLYVRRAVMLKTRSEDGVCPAHSDSGWGGVNIFRALRGMRGACRMVGICRASFRAGRCVR